MQSYLLGQYEKSMPHSMSLREKLLLSRKCGFDYLEISVDETDEKLSRLDWGKEERHALRRAVEEAGQPVLSMCLSAHRKYPLGSSNPETAAQSLAISEKAVQFCAEIGIRQIQLAGYDVYYEPSTEETRERFTENLRKTVGYAEKYGVLLGFETMETPFMNTCAKAMRYVSEINSPYLQIYPDVGNLTNALGDPLADLADAHGHITAAHLKETLPGQFRDVPFGTGHTPYVPAIRMLREMGVGMFVLEFWYVDGADPERYVQEARAYIAEKFREADVR